MNPPHAITPRSMGRWALNLAAFALLVWAVADAFRFSDNGQPSAVVAADPAPSSAAAGDEPRAVHALAAHLFGRAEQEPRARIADVPATSLDLRLMGVVDSTDRQQARALIGVGGGPARYFSVNQLIAGSDARVRVIAADQVVIERGGQLERVLLWSPENMARANEGVQPPPLPGVAVPAYPDLNAGNPPPASATAPAASLLPIPPRRGAANDTP